MLFFNHPKPPSRKEVAMQMQHRAGLVPNLGVIVVESKQMQQAALQEKVRPDPA